jgi:hypothetical protein
MKNARHILDASLNLELLDSARHVIDAILLWICWRVLATSKDAI